MKLRKYQQDKIFGVVIRHRRKSKKMTSRKLAGLCNVSHIYMRKIEVGICPPPAEDKIKRMARCLGINSDFLLRMAGKIDTELYNIILKNNTAPDFLRNQYRKDERHNKKRVRQYR